MDQYNIMKEKKKNLSIVVIILLILAVAAFALCFVFFIGRNDETFSDVRAYRTEVSENDFILDDPVVVDPSGTEDYEELRNEASEAYQILNDERTAQGLEPLKWSFNLEMCSLIRAYEIGYNEKGEYFWAAVFGG